MKMEFNNSEEIQLNFFDILTVVDEPSQPLIPDEPSTVLSIPELSDNGLIVSHVKEDYISTERLEWSLDDVINLKESLLMTSLHQMKDKKSAFDTRVDIRAWMESTDNGGFSFNECCAVCGVEPEELRDELEKY